MKHFIMLAVDNLPLILGSLALLANAICGVVIIIKKTVQKIKKGEEIVPTLEQTYLELKEVARKCIYEKEEMYKSMSTGGMKMGAFKLDSVLSTIETACLRRGVDFDSLYWTDYINEDVKNMKGVK